MDNKHSEYSPSQLERIIACPGSVQLCRTVPKPPTSAYAAEGTLLHDYAHQALENWEKGVVRFTDDLEHMSTVYDAVNYLHKEINFGTPRIRRFHELKVAMEEPDEIYGTLDFASVSPDRLDIADFKFGQGIKVHVEGNPQLLAYLAGFLNMIKVKYPKSFDKVMALPWFMHVVQPRLDHYDCVHVTPRELLEFQGLAAKTVRLANGTHPPVYPGEVQCRWCAAGAVCKVRLNEMYISQTEALKAFADMKENKADLEELQKVLETKTEMMQIFKAIEQHIFLELSKGTKVEKYKLVRGRSNRQWAPKVDFDTLLTSFPELEERAEDLLDTKLRGPAQIERLLTPDRRKDLEEFITKPLGKLSLAHVSSSKEAVDVTNPVEAFKDFID